MERLNHMDSKEDYKVVGIPIVTQRSCRMDW